MRRTPRPAVEDCHVLAVKDLDLDPAKGTEAVAVVEVWGKASRVRVVSTPARLGGVRWWLVCSCGRRVLKLYLPPGSRRLACWTCHGLTYRSSQEAHHFDLVFREIARGTGLSLRDVRAYFRELDREGEK